MQLILTQSSDCHGTRWCNPQTVRAPVSAGQFHTVGKLSGYLMGCCSIPWIWVLLTLFHCYCVVAYRWVLPVTYPVCLGRCSIPWIWILLTLLPYYCTVVYLWVVPVAYPDLRFTICILQFKNLQLGGMFRSKPRGVCSISLILAVLYRAGLNASIVILWELQSRHIWIDAKFRK